MNLATKAYELIGNFQRRGLRYPCWRSSNWSGPDGILTMKNMSQMQPCARLKPTNARRSKSSKILNTLTVCGLRMVWDTHFDLVEHMRHYEHFSTQEEAGK